MNTHNKINNQKFKNSSLLKSKEEIMHSRLIASTMNDVSFSMFYDNKKKLNQSIIKYNTNCDSPRREKHHYKNIEPRNLKLWVDDKNVSKCYKCNSEFSFFYRKHHCRCCGRIFCYHCCYDRIDIPEQITENELPIQSLSQNNVGILSKDSTDEFKHPRRNQRVCIECKTKILEIRNLDPLIQIFDLLDLTLEDYRVMKHVCKKWMCIANYYSSNFRELQYSLPNHKFTDKEKKMLFNNRFLFYGHSKLIVQLIKSIDWINVTEELEKEILNILQNNRIKKCKCWTLMCTRDCRRRLKAEDSIQLLYANITNYKIRQYALNCLRNTPREELLCYLPFLVYHIRYELFFDNYQNKLISKFLLDKSQENRVFALETYWEIYSQIDDVDYKLVCCYKKLLENLTKLLKTNFKQTHNMIDTFETYKTKSINDIKKSLLKNKFNFNNIPFPFTKNSQIDVDNIKRMKSATRPLMFTYSSPNKLKRQILFKYEDIRKERIIMKIIKLMDIILKRDKIDLQFVTYDILAIGNKYGFISIVPNSKTLYNIECKEKFSIQNYIIENNPNLPINIIRNNFIKSCASACVIGYLIGLGDRHLDNIMISNTGLLFHIDFGFILGNDPKPLAPEMKITPEMIDAMGGQNSIGYNQFQKLCSKAYNCLRRHSNIFVALLSMLSKLSPEIDNGKFTEQFIDSQVIKRFIPGELYTEASLQYKTQIINNYNTSTLIDYCYYHKKETLEKNIEVVTGFFSNIGSSITSYLYTSSPSTE